MLFLVLLGTVLAERRLWPTTSSAGAVARGGRAGTTPATPPCCFPAFIAGGTTFVSEPEAERRAFSGASGAAGASSATICLVAGVSTSSGGSSAGASGGPELAQDELEHDRRTGFLGESSISLTSGCASDASAASDSSGAVGMVVPSVFVKEPREELELDMRPPVMDTSKFASSISWL